MFRRKKISNKKNKIPLSVSLSKDICLHCLEVAMGERLPLGLTEDEPDLPRRLFEHSWSQGRSPCIKYRKRRNDPYFSNKMVPDFCTYKFEHAVAANMENK